MYQYFIYSAFGWLAFSGTMHFIVDVVSQYLRGKHVPGTEATLYYGLHSAFSLGQVAFGILGLYLAKRNIHLLMETPIILLCLFSGIGWLAVTFYFMEYWEPKLAVSLFILLILATWIVRVRI